MKEPCADAKEKILNAVVTLLLEHKDAAKITNRQIAALAGVNSALINYYYQSKENLMDKAVEVCLNSIAGRMFENADVSVPPKERLRRMIKTISTFMFENYQLSSIAVISELKSGSFATTRILLPILKEIFGESKSEAALKLTALQIVSPMQVIFLNAKAYADYLYEDMFDEAARNRLLDRMIDNVFHEAEKL